MATSRHAAILVVATLAVLFIGSADAWGRCPSGYKDCNPHKTGCETCIRNDVNNCGDCGKKCKNLPYTTAKCDNHKCVYTCKPGWADCDHNKYKNGCETDIGKDAKNCGSCGKTCKNLPYTTAKCEKNKCVYTCKPGWADCDKDMYKNGCETDIGKDGMNCGGCGKKCQDFPFTTVKCEKNSCVYTCKPGRADCDRNLWQTGCETEIGKDAHNCGGCRKQCKQVAHAITKCSNGHCQNPVCEAGWGNCDNNIWNGCEKYLDKDVYNCGKCHNKCQVTLKGGEATCKNGQCGQQCKKGSKFDKHKNCCVRDH